MGYMKELDIRIRNGGDDAIAAACELAGVTMDATLTDAEREAIYRAEARLRTAYVPDDETAATLRSLLERLG
jgi:hypothetical protein